MFGTPYTLQKYFLHWIPLCTSSSSEYVPTSICWQLQHGMIDFGIF